MATKFLEFATPLKYIGAKWLLEKKLILRPVISACLWKRSWGGGDNSKQTKYLLTLALQVHWLPKITGMVSQKFSCQCIKAEDPYRHQPNPLF